MFDSCLRRTAAGLLAFAAATAQAGTVTSTETFEGGSNQAGWTFGPPPNLQSSGGNPGWYLRTAVDTFAPSLRTTAAQSPFFGDYRASRVTSLGVDLKTFAVQFPFQREVTLVLWSGNCAVYRLGTEFVPAIGAAWKPFDIAVDPDSTTMPAGWQVHPSSPCQAPNATWNSVITNVTKVEFFYGDPQFFYIFDIWTIGADNLRIARENDWTDLGNGLAGSSGIPTLQGSGEIAAGQTIQVTLANTLPNSTAFLMIGLAPLNAPMLGGVLVPDVTTTNLVVPLPTDAGGGLVISTAWPSGVPAGTDLYLQYWIADPAGIFGAAATNGLLGEAH